MARQQNLNRFESPVAWGILFPTFYSLFAKLRCVLADCPPTDKVWLNLLFIPFWIITIYCFVPTATLFVQWFYWTVCRLWPYRAARPRWYRATGISLCEGMIGALTGTVVYWLLESWQQRSLCMAQHACKTDNGYAEYLFLFLEKYGFDLCRGQGVCFDLVRNIHWPMIAGLAFLFNWLIESKLFPKDSCSSGSGPRNDPPPAPAPASASAPPPAPAPGFQHIHDAIQKTVRENMTKFVRTLCPEEQAKRILDAAFTNQQCN